MKLRSLALVAISFLCAACVGFTGDPTAPPSRAASPGPSPSPSVPDLSSFTPFPVATPTSEPCPGEPIQWNATLDLKTGTGVVSIDLQDGVTVPLPSESVTPVDPAEVVIEGTVLGGTETRGDLVLGDLDDDSATVITALTARFLPLDGSAAAPVAVALDGRSLSLTLPDKDSVGRLLLQIDWNTRCGSGSGGGGTAVLVQNSKVAAGCPTTDDAMMSALKKIGAYRITIGGLDEPLDVDAWSARWSIGNGVDDYGTFFPNWAKTDLVTVGPGVFVPVREKVDELHLVSVRASIYDRADVDASIDSNGDVDPVTVVRRDVNPNGNVNIPAPLDPGNYVFVVEANWLTNCFEIHTTRTIAVKVS
ncbi:MAG TPA: hypothetical protein VJ850_08945 [Candidatus Limnocylindrales bacterium]|nr:hypothetical protein [Candidatus Limnocylindrales bacterium]